MKSIFAKFAPGVFLVAAVMLAFAFGNLNAQNPKPELAAPSLPPTAQPNPEAVRQILVCGACGAQLEAPRPVMIAAPVARAAMPASYYAGDCLESPYTDRRGIVWAPAYYGQYVAQPTSGSALFGDYRVNPIPLPTGGVAYTQHRHR